MCIRDSFKPAEYDNNGIKLDYPGVHYHEIGNTVILEESDDYLDYIMSKGTVLMYDYRHFLNIWLINNSKSSSSIVTAPTVIDRPEAVSYTHLDVYKRQLLYQLERRKIHLQEYDIGKNYARIVSLV